MCQQHLEFLFHLPSKLWTGLELLCLQHLGEILQIKRATCFQRHRLPHHPFPSASSHWAIDEMKFCPDDLPGTSPPAAHAAMPESTCEKPFQNTFVTSLQRQPKKSKNQHSILLRSAFSLSSSPLLTTVRGIPQSLFI